MAKSLLQILVVLGNVAVPVASFATGLRRSAEPLWLLRRPRLLFRSLLTVLLVVPFVEFVLARLLAPDDLYVRAGIVISILAIGIGPPELLQRTDAKGGAASYEVGLNLVLMTLAVAYLPAAVAIHGGIFQHALDLPWQLVGRIVLAQALLPFYAGVAVAHHFPRVAAPIERNAPRIVAGVDGAVLLVALLFAAPALVAIDVDVWIICLVIAAVAIAIGHLAGGPKRETRIVLASVSAIRFPPLAILVVSMLPRQGAAALVPVIVAYFISSTVLVALYRAALARRNDQS